MHSTRHHKRHKRSPFSMSFGSLIFGYSRVIWIWITQALWILGGCLTKAVFARLCLTPHTQLRPSTGWALCTSGHWKTFTAITCDISTVNQIINFNRQSPSVPVGKAALSSVWENKSPGVPRPSPQRRWHGSAHIGPALHRERSWDSLLPSQKELFASGASKEKENKPAQRRRCR